MFHGEDAEGDIQSQNHACDRRTVPACGVPRITIARMRRVFHVPAIGILRGGATRTRRGADDVRVVRFAAGRGNHRVF